MINPEHLERIRSDIKSRIRYPELNQLLDDMVAAYERCQLMKDPVCGNGYKGWGCGKVLRWDSPDWDSPAYAKKQEPDPLAAIRCLDCGVVWCLQCARKHFDAVRPVRPIKQSR